MLIKKCRECGHVGPETEFRKSQNHCKPCSVRRSIAWQKKNIYRAREINREYLSRNRDRILKRQKSAYKKRRPAALAYMKERARKYPWAMQSHRRNKAMPPTIFSGFMRLQKGLCAICHQPPNGKCFQIDHNHENGIVRGLLCSNCNFGIGFLMDDPTMLRRAADYLDGNTGFETEVFEKGNCLILEAS